jgi:DNA-directed RNA polymerase subunit M/transcription elongation factor TFIIS
MSKAYTTCDKCGKEIHYGNAYVSVQRNIEQAEHNFVNNEDDVQVIDSELLLTLCGSCGNKFHFDILAKLIEAIPINSPTIGFS